MTLEVRGIGEEIKSAALQSADFVGSNSAVTQKGGGTMKRDTVIITLALVILVLLLVAVWAQRFVA